MTNANTTESAAVDNAELAAHVKRIVVKTLKIDPAKVVEDASFADDLGADSLDQVELVMELEREFGCEIPDEAAANITTVRSAISYIESKLN